MKPRCVLAILPLLMLVSGAPPLWSQAQVEAPKPKGAEAIHLESLLNQAQDALKARHWQEAVPLLNQIIEMDPRRWEAFQALGNACLNLARYQEAIGAYEKGIAICQAELAGGAPKAGVTRIQAGMGQMLAGEGNAFLKLGRPQSALAPYTKAAEIDPNPGLAYFNLAATLYNQGQMEAAAAACDKAIAADPKRADAYFIKGSALYGNGTIDSKNQYIVPPGTVEALKRYLVLAPKGGHASDAKAMLDALGPPVETKPIKKK